MGCCCIKGFWSKLEARIAERFTETEITDKEVFIVLLQYRKIRPSFMHVKGNGALVLTRHVLWFTLFMPRQDVEIPLWNITKITVLDTLSRPGIYIKYFGRTLMLSIEFTGESGEEDELVLAFPKTIAPLWKQQIEEAKKAISWDLF